MSERALPTRKRKKDSGSLIRVSRLVYSQLDKDRRSKSWDEYFRRILGLPTREGKDQPLVEGVLEVHSGLLILCLPTMGWSDAEELAYKVAARQVKPQKPIRMREVR